MMALRALLIFNIWILPSWADAQEVSSEKRQLTLELDELPGATAYQIEIQAADRNATDKKYVFSNKKAKFVINLRPGHFTMRTRVADEREVFGPWSEVTALAVAPRAPTPTSPESGKTILQKDRPQVEFQWSSVSGCEQYRLLVVDGETGATVIDQLVKGTSLAAKLPPGRTYRWSVQSQAGKDLLSDQSDSPQLEFVYIGSSLPKPDFKKQTIRNVKLEADVKAESIHCSLRREDDKGALKALDQGQFASGSTLNYQLEENVLYGLEATAHHPRFESSEPSLLFFERRGDELISYGENRPKPSQRLWMRNTRWSGLVKSFDLTFEGDNKESGRQTHIEKNQGFTVRAGVDRKGKGFNKRADISYSRFGVSSSTSQVTVGLFQANYTSLWLKNWGWRRVPLRLQFGAGYDQVAEFVGYEDGHFDTYFMRTLGPSLGIESTLKLSSSQNVVLGFKVTLPVYATNVPQGKLEKGSRVNLDARYEHDFLGFTGALSLEIQGQDYTYGTNSSQFNLSSGGFGLGILY